jgi:hypothetical protein
VVDPDACRIVPACLGLDTVVERALGELSRDPPSRDGPAVELQLAGAVSLLGAAPDLVVARAVDPGLSGQTGARTNSTGPEICGDEGGGLGFLCAHLDPHDAAAPAILGEQLSGQVRG